MFLIISKNLTLIHTYLVGGSLCKTGVSSRTKLVSGLSIYGPDSLGGATGGWGIGLLAAIGSWSEFLELWIGSPGVNA